MCPSACITVKAVTHEPRRSLRTSCCRAVRLDSDRTALSLTESSTIPKYSACWLGWGVLFFQLIANPNLVRCSIN